MATGFSVMDALNKNSKAEEQKTGSSQRISFPALRLDEMESSQKNI